MGKLERRPIRSDPNVQLLLYFNLLFSIQYLLLIGPLVINKLMYFDFKSALQRGASGPVFMLWVLTEPPRLYYGFSGNLQEKVPQMSAFLLMTIFPQMPCVAFLTLFQEHIFPVDRAAGWIMFVFLMLEVILGSFGLQVFIRQQTTQFYRQCNEQAILGMSAGGAGYESLTTKED